MKPKFARIIRDFIFGIIATTLISAVAYTHPVDHSRLNFLTESTSNSVFPNAPLACPGCCSSHGGISNSCASNGKIRCVDGTTSPTCSCSSCGVATPPPQLSQFITFTNPPNALLADHMSTLTATSSSGLTVNLVSLTPTICRVIDKVATFLIAGTCSVSASQSGNSTYAAASSVTRSFTISVCNAPSVTLTLSVTNPSVRSNVIYSATVTGGVAPYSYQWDLDGDSVDDRQSSINTISTNYDRAQSVNVRLRVTDGAGCAGLATRAITVTAPDLRYVSDGLREQICGDGDSVLDPGERWRISANVKNSGLAAENAFVQFSPNIVTGAVPVIVTQGAGFLGNLGAGQSISTSAEIKIPNDAACGSTLGLNYVAAIDDRSVSTVSTRINLNIPTTCNIVSTCALPAPIKLRGGSFFNPSRSGNGLVSFVIERAAPQVPIFFGTWFTGDSNRNPTWYIVSGDLIGNHVSAQILKIKRDLSTLPGLTTINSEVGKAQISLMTPEKFLFSYQFITGSNAGRSGGEIMQHVFAGLAPAVPDITGHYFSQAESGWGQTYESYISQGVAQQFIVTYLYDAAGEPRWVLGSFPDTVASGPANSYEVHCPGCAWLDIAPSMKSVGTQTRMFPNGFGNAIIGTQFVLPAPLIGTWNKNALTLTPLSDRQ